MNKSAILITNFPNPYQELVFANLKYKEQHIHAKFGYDIKFNYNETALQTARDLITALLTFDKIYIEGNHIEYLVSIFGSEKLKELLRLHLLCIIPDYELNPVVVEKAPNEWVPDFFSYAISDGKFASEKESKWNYIEYILYKYEVSKLDTRVLLYLIDENSTDTNDINEIKNQIQRETCSDIEYISNIYCAHANEKQKYCYPAIIRLQELNKTMVLSAMLGIENIKSDAAINKLIRIKTASPFGKDIHTGTDAILRIEQQKGFPDIGDLYVNKIINLDDVLKLRDSFQGKIFRYWTQKSDYDEKLMQKEIMSSVHNILGSKCMNPVRFIGTNLIGLLGVIPGLAASAFDSFILDKISKGWHPNFFLDDKLKKMIDTCIARENKRIRKEKQNEAFKGIEKNDPCPCGSGKKYKKCHGKD